MQLRGELLIGQRVELGGGRGGDGLGRPQRARAGEQQHHGVDGLGERVQCRISALGGLQGSRARGNGLIELAVEGDLQRQRDEQRHRQRRRLLADRAERRFKALAGAAVPAHRQLDRGQGGDRLGPVGSRTRGQRGRDLHQRVARRRQRAGRGLGQRERWKQRQTALGLAGGQQRDRDREQLRGRRRRAARHLRGGLGERLDRGVIARTGGHRDVVGPRRGGGSHLGQGLGRAPVGGHPPAGGDRVIHRTAHDRMAEAKQPRNRLGSDQAQREQLVDELQAVLSGQARGRGRELGVKRLAGHGRSLEQTPGPGRDLAQLLLDRRDHGVGDLDRAARIERARQLRRVAGAAGAGELFGVERVAAALLEDLAATGLGHVRRAAAPSVPR